MKRSLMCLSILAAFGGSPALAEKLVLGPSSDWKVREYDDKCRLSRNFGAGEDGVTLWLDKGGYGPGMNVTLIGRPFRHPYGTEISIGFAPEPEVRRNYISAKSSKGRPVLSMFGVKPVDTNPIASEGVDEEGDETVDLGDGQSSDPAFPADFSERLAAIQSLELSGSIMEPVSLKLESAGDALVSLGECTEKLITRLSNRVVAKDTDTSGSLAREAAPKDMNQWAARISANYPYHLLKKEQEGSVGVRLTINNKGRASFCEVVRYSGPASFNDSACLALLRHAQFYPALDTEGKPAAGFYSTTITYVLNR